MMVKTLLFYFLLSLFVLRGIVFSPGVIQGGDWGLPVTLSQMWLYFKNGFYTWTDINFFGIEQFFLHSLPFYTLIGVLARLGLDGGIYIKALLVLAFVFPAFTMYLLCKFLSCDKKVAILGGVLYLTLPFFFNYAAIGWILILFSMGILPLAIITFIKSIKTKRVFYSVLTGLFYFLAMIQPQSLVWYSLVFFSLFLFLVRDKKTLFVYLRSFLIIFFVFLGMNAFWLLPLFLGGGGAGTLSTKLGLSTVSLGTWARLSDLNILRGWGSLFNYQYETSYLKILEPLSFILPLLAFSSLIFLRKKKIIYSLILLSFVPVTLFNLGPNFIVRLPFSDLIRDMARFSVISSFSYVILGIITLDFMFRSRQRKLKLLGFILSVLLIINGHPFWNGELFAEQKETQDIRLRTYQFPEEYVLLEKFLAEGNKDIKVLYLPLGGALNALDDEKFYGMYKEMRDIFANYSPKPGEIGISDRDMGSATDLILKLKEIQDNRQFNDLSKLLSLMGVKYVAVRKNVDFARNISGEEIASLLERRIDLSLIKEWDKISVFENNNFLPHFYISQKIIYSDGGVASLPEILSFGDYEIRSGTYLEKSKVKSQKSKVEEEKILERADGVFVVSDLINTVTEEKLGINLPVVSFPFVKNNPESLIYRFVLLNEGFDKWKVRKDPEKIFEKHLFYASKRIAELVNFEIKDVGQLSSLMENYKQEMKSAIGKTRKVEKLKAYLEAHRRKIDQSNLNNQIKEKIRGIFDDLDDKIAELRPEEDFSRLVYKVKIPKGGDYEVFIRFSEVKKNWTKLGEKNFEKGEQELILPVSGISENLVDEKLIIKDYLPDSIYRISFDYKNPAGDAGFFIGESEGGKIAETVLSSTDEKFRHFEKFFKSSSGTRKAIVHLTVPEERNLKVERIYQPEILLKSVKPMPTDRQDKPPTPKITFVKINSTKYRVKVEGVKEPYTLVFSESFHQGWKLYVNRNSAVPEIEKLENMVAGGDRNMPPAEAKYGEIIASYFDGEVKEGTHRNIFLDRDTFETWGKKPIPEERHWLVNGYANSWYITPEDSGGRENYEVIVEFQPQRLFYLGFGISLATLLACLGYLGYGFVRRKK